MDFSAYGSPSPEWLSFLKTNPAAAQDGFSGNDPGQASVLRSVSNKIRSEASAQLIVERHLDQKVRIETASIQSREEHIIPLRIYRPINIVDGEPRGAVLYFHGGGYLLGNETTDDAVCCRIAAGTCSVVASVIYRHTDEHKHPAQVNDAWDAFEYIRQHASDLNIPIRKGFAVMGISAGCTLGASVILKEIESSRNNDVGRSSAITGALLAIPWLIHIDNYPMDVFKSPQLSSKIQHADAPVIPTPRLKLFSDLLGARDTTDRLLNIPLLADDELEGWPQTVLQVAGADPLRDDGLIFAKRLEALSVPTGVHIYPGLPHGFRRWDQLPATNAFDSDSIAAINKFLARSGQIENEKMGWQVYGRQ